MKCRQDFITGLATTSIIAVAGCSGGNGSSGAPANTLNSYREAYNNGNAEEANQYIYEDGEWSKVAEGEAGFDGEVLDNEIREITASDAKEISNSSDNLNIAGTGEEEIKQGLERLSSQADINDATLVYWKDSVRIEGEEYTNENIIVMVKLNQEWLIYGYLNR